MQRLNGMTHMRLLLLLLGALPQILCAQSFQRVVAGIPIEHNNQILGLPFTGGLDAFLPQFVDLDADGEFD